MIIYARKCLAAKTLVATITPASKCQIPQEAPFKPPLVVFLLPVIRGQHAHADWRLITLHGSAILVGTQADLSAANTFIRTDLLRSDHLFHGYIIIWLLLKKCEYL